MVAKIGPEECCVAIEETCPVVVVWEEFHVGVVGFEELSG
jgi:hypothetical protein